MTKKQLADALGLKLRQIENLVLDGMPRVKAGRSHGYGVEAVVWYFRRREEREKAHRPDLKQSQERFEAARAAKMELELELLQGESVKLVAVREEMGRILDRLRATILNIPPMAAPRLVGCKTVRQATAQLAEAMREVLAVLQETSEGDQDDGHRSTAKKAKKRARGRGPSTAPAAA